jgi:hypothetical protein
MAVTLLDKDVVASAHAAYLRGDGDPLLALMNDDMHDNVSQQSGRASGSSSSTGSNSTPA